MKTFVASLAVLASLAFAGGAQAQSCPSTGPTLVYPPNNAGNVPRDTNNSVTVKWDAVASTVAYDVFFGPPGTGCSNVRATVTGTTFSPPSSEIVDGASYEWKVVAKGADGCPLKPSTCAAFTMASCPASAPVLSEPANNSSVAAGVVNLKWQSVANASFYEIFVSVDNGTPALAGISTGTEKTISVEPGRSIQWAVKAAAAGCTGFISQPFVFTTPCPTQPPALLTPPNGATFKEDATIVFSRSTEGNPAGSGVYKSTDGGQTWSLVADNLGGRSYATQLPIGNYLWRVRANYPGGCSFLESAPSSFSVTGASCENAAPVLIAPADGSSHTLPFTVAWTAPAAAKTFLIFASGPNGTSVVGQTTASPFVVTGLAPGSYQLFVVAKFDNNCPDVSSARRTITVKARECPPETINLTSPVNGASVASPAVLSWTAIANATAYRIWGSFEGSAPLLLARTTALSASLSLPAGALKWRVEGIRDGCPSVFSAEGNFTVQTGANCSSNTAPQLLPPVITDDDPATAGKTVVLPWIAQTRGILARVFLAEIGQAFEDVGVTRADQFQILLQAGHYRWFVQLFFEGCPPLSSAFGELTVEDTIARCPSDKPSIIEPANGSTITNLRIRLSDPAADEKVRYRFFLIVDSTNAALPPFTFANTEFDPIVQPPPGTYRAHVERVVGECPSVSSDTITFTIARAQNCPTAVPELISPANNSQSNPPNVRFEWGGTFPAGTKFVLFVQSNDGEPTPVAATTEMSVEHLVPPGRIRWRVAAFPPGCDRLFSKENIAGIALPQGCSPVAPIGLQPPDGAQIEAGDVPFEWTPVPDATSYELFVAKKGEVPTLVATTADTKAIVTLSSAGTVFWLVNAVTNCPATPSAINDLTVIEAGECGTPGEPKLQVIGRAVAGQGWTVRWIAGRPAGNGTFELQKSYTSDFADPETILVTGNSIDQDEALTTGAVQIHYRVRALSACNDEKGSYSDAGSVVVVAPRTNNASVDAGARGEIVQQLFIPGSATPSSFSIAFDKPWVKATPASGPLPPEGATVTLTSERDQLRLGGNTFTAKITTDTPNAGKVKSNGTTFVSIPINVSLVTPVTPDGKSAPSPESLIFSAVGHAPGQNGSFFESDMRVVNLSAQTMKYQINYTPTGTDGTVTGSTTTVDVAPNQSLALDDIVSTVFGLGEITGALGMLEVRPLTTSSSSGSLFSTISSTAQQLLTLGSSRTYNFTPNGTFGQYIPAIPFAKFVGSGKILSLLHVAQSDEYRANFGFLEASGNPVSLVSRVYDTSGNLLATIPVSLLASENKQIGLMLATNGITDLEDGRVEVEVTSGTGKVTAYVSELDNATNDPFLVSAVEKGSVSADRYVVPGMAHKDLGFAFWVSDLRIHNPGTTSVPATLTFYTEGNPSSFVAKEVTIDAGEIEVLNDVVLNLFGQPNGAGGSIVITTPAAVSLGVTARTYNKTTTGTYGQYLPAVTVAESVGAADRALHILQVEESTRMRTNIALTETTGSPATVEASLILPDSIVTPVITFNLAGNEFRQFTVRDFGEADAVYNARVTVKVVGGTGKVTAHGSLIDAITNDPALIPPQ
ncbi:MAG TPA: hypothetical protein VNA69_10315 [Thermoanaerobaculia bacterium]|nr:hypothetical protein [Thermoanaerobaculia bacterium]